MTRIAEFAVLLVLCVVMVPATLWYKTHGQSMYIDKFFWLFLFMFLAVILTLTPLKFTQMSPVFKYCSVGLSFWFVSALIYELWFFNTPADKMPNLNSVEMFTKHLFFFVFGLVGMFGFWALKKEIENV